MTPNLQDTLGLYRWMHTARCVDAIELEFVARGEAFFQVSGGGHEASAALAPFLVEDDFLHCHYRDKALLLARGVPVEAFFDSLLGNAASHSGGRQMSAHMSAPDLNVLSIVGPVGNGALHAVGVATEIKDRASRPIVVCALGDGTTQQGEVLEAIAEAVRSALPVLFLIEDNRYAISTRTGGKTFFNRPDGEAAQFYGLPLNTVDGADPLACRARFETLVRGMRAQRGPALCLMRVERLTQHTNADDESAYRSPAELAHARATGDPIARLRAALPALGVARGELAAIDAQIAAAVRSAAESCLAASAAPAARAPAPVRAPEAEYRGSPCADGLTMVEALRRTLANRMASDPRVTLYGQDIEDPKGDVFGVTRGLTAAFPGRVRNAPLSESTIIGASIGRALAGGRPVAFLQFADFIPLAFNQLASELASMAWRTCDGWTAPVIVMVSCGAFRPGLGPFHAQTYESIVAHLPGIDVAMPCSAGDAAGMLNAAFRSERPTVLFYPKALLNERACTTSPDVERHFVPSGAARIVTPGRDLTIVAYGNTVALCRSAAHTLAEAGVEAEVIDLRWISPWDADAVCASVRKTGRLLVVHEDNAQVGFGAEVVATVCERVPRAVQCRRVARPDSFVPYHYGRQLELLPSYRRILEAATGMLGVGLQWERVRSERDDEDRQVIPLLGSSPADRSVQLVELFVKVGDKVTAGQTIASVEADKAIMDLAAPADGEVEAIHLQLLEHAPVETPLMTLSIAKRQRAAATTDAAWIAHLGAFTRASGALPAGDARRSVCINGLGTVRGNARLDNASLARLMPAYARTAGGANDPILELTGIESRVVAGADQDMVSMAAEAATLALREAGIRADDLALVVCSTSTPLSIAPSTACQVLARLGCRTQPAAYDLAAACSGYLFALASAWDFLQHRPHAYALVITSETMRRIVDAKDPSTSLIFADAATATVLSMRDDAGVLARLARPVIGTHPDADASLRVPLPDRGEYVRMQGSRVFSTAVKRMAEMLGKACAESELALTDLDLVVPHQANGRIIEAMRLRLDLPQERIWNRIRMDGNTSSSSIPLALDDVLRLEGAARRIGLCAFGGGFTFGGAVLHKAASSPAVASQAGAGAVPRAELVPTP